MSSPTPGLYIKRCRSMCAAVGYPEKRMVGRFCFCILQSCLRGCSQRLYTAHLQDGGQDSCFALGINMHKEFSYILFDFISRRSNDSTHRIAETHFQLSVDLQPLSCFLSVKLNLRFYDMPFAPFHDSPLSLAPWIT